MLFRCLCFILLHTVCAQDIIKLMRYAGSARVLLKVATLEGPPDTIRCARGVRLEKLKEYLWKDWHAPSEGPKDTVAKDKEASWEGPTEGTGEALLEGLCGLCDVILLLYLLDLPSCYHKENDVWGRQRKRQGIRRREGEEAGKERGGGYVTNTQNASLLL